MEVCLINSYQLYKSEKNINISLYEYRIKILEKLLPNVFLDEEIPLAIRTIHFPKQINKETNSRRAKRKQCRQCATSKIYLVFINLIVFDLVRPLLNRGHTLVMDNFYNSPLLSRIMKAQGTDTLGTLRLNREFVPDTLRSKNKINMATGEVAFSQTRDMTIIVWKDANIVSLLSTYHPVKVGGKEKFGTYRYPNFSINTARQYNSR